MNMEIKIPQDDPAWLLSAQLEELDYRELYRAYSSQGRNSTAESRIIFEVFVFGYMSGIYSTHKLEETCRKHAGFLCFGYSLNKLWAKCNTSRLKTHLFGVKKE